MRNYCARVLYRRRVAHWLLTHWEEWYFVDPGNREGMRLLLRAMKADNVIASLGASHCQVPKILRELQGRS